MWRGSLRSGRHRGLPGAGLRAVGAGTGALSAGAAGVRGAGPLRGQRLRRQEAAGAAQPAREPVLTSGLAWPGTGGGAGRFLGASTLHAAARAPSLPGRGEQTARGHLRLESFSGLNPHPQRAMGQVPPEMAGPHSQFPDQTLAPWQQMCLFPRYLNRRCLTKILQVTQGTSQLGASHGPAEGLQHTAKDVWLQDKRITLHGQADVTTDCCG